MNAWSRGEGPARVRVGICIHSGGEAHTVHSMSPRFVQLFPTQKISVSVNERSSAGQSSFSTAQHSSTHTFHLSYCLKKSCVYHKTW